MEIIVLMSQPEHQRVPQTGKHNLFHMKPRNVLFNSGFMNWIALAIQYMPLSAHNPPEVQYHPSIVMRIASYVVAG